MSEREDRKISLHVIRRLPRYLRFLSNITEQGINRISSLEIGRQMRLAPSQVRQDFNYFGGFGQQGYGYNVSQLQNKIHEILQIDECLPAVLIGVGNLGSAIYGFILNGSYGISLIGLFDKDPAGAAIKIPGIKVLDISGLEAFCQKHKPETAILCIPEEGAQSVAERLAALGIKGIWNFSQADLRLPDRVLVENVHLGDSLLTLGFQLKDNTFNIK